MLVFVDFEHAAGHESKHGERMLAARTTITYRLEDLSGLHCHLVRYDRIDQALLDTLGASAIFISGNSIAPERYAPEDLAAMYMIVKQTTLPIFGFCGGFQLIAQAMGTELLPLNGDSSTDDESVITLENGRLFEFGYYPIKRSPGSDHPLFAGLGHQPVFRHAHGLNVPAPPTGFQTLASTDITPVQMAVDNERKILGTQFHPEYWTEDHPDGKTLISNFLRWSGLVERER